MKDNRIESFSALEGALNNLQQLSNEVSNTLNQTSSTYDTQQEGWSSAPKAQRVLTRSLIYLSTSLRKIFSG